jgi:hypothetical protein
MQALLLIGSDSQFAAVGIRDRAHQFVIGLAAVERTLLCADSLGTRMQNLVGAGVDQAINLSIGVAQFFMYAGGEPDAGDALNSFRNPLGQAVLYNTQSPIVAPAQGVVNNVAEDLAVLGASSAAPEGTASVEASLSNLATGRSQGVNVVNSIDELNELFGRLIADGRPVEGTTYSGKLVELSDGTTVGLRTVSKSGGPTIDIKLPDGTLRKVHVAQ